MERVLLFSLTAMANPTLLAATTLTLLLPEPKKVMSGYLLGALTVSITLGMIIVFTLQDSEAVSTAKRTVNPAADLAIGTLLLLIAFVLGTGRHEGLVERRHARAATKADEAPPRWQRAIGRGSPRTAFLVGVLLTLPGASYLAALTSIVKLDAGTAESALLVVMVNVIMLAFLEVPLLGFMIAPEWTPRTVQRAKRWFARHGARSAMIGATLVGCLLILRAVITIVS